MTDKESRFEFGKNWTRFLDDIDREALDSSIRDIRRLFRVDGFEGLSVLDIGSGSGLSSLAFLNMGAERLQSFDYDSDSVSATESLHTGAGSPDNWKVGRGDILDSGFIGGLGSFDVVYSWGVLHHTGDMWQAIENAASLCRENGGLLMIGIYNKKPPITDIMHLIKRTYTDSGPILRTAIKGAYLAPNLAYRIAMRKPVISEIVGYKKKRGMNFWRDLDDWLGGYPYETASPGEIYSFVERLGFSLVNMNTGVSAGHVNEYLFLRG